MTKKITPQDDGFRRRVQVARPAVVAKPGPELQHLSELGGRQRAHGAEALQETPVVGSDDRSLGLLQHHLGDPDAVGVAGSSPRQVSPLTAVPIEEVAGEDLGRGGELGV